MAKFTPKDLNELRSLKITDISFEKYSNKFFLTLNSLKFPSTVADMVEKSIGSSRGVMATSGGVYIPKDALTPENAKTLFTNLVEAGLLEKSKANKILRSLHTDIYKKVARRLLLNIVPKIAVGLFALAGYNLLGSIAQVSALYLFVGLTTFYYSATSFRGNLKYLLRNIKGNIMESPPGKSN